jgi:nucleoid-associated protein YgaU
MIATSIGRIVLPSLALVAACGAALVFGITHVGRESPLEAKAATAALAVSPPALNSRDEGWAALAAAQAEATVVAAAPAVSPRSLDTGESVPVFDIARIERTGDAVIAGRAAPGATVELLRNGERHDRVVADQSGQFVMVPPRLHPGDYQLTLRSSQPDGKQASSKQSVVVALAEVESSSGAVRSRAEAPFNVPEPLVANRSVLDQVTGSSQAQQPSQPNIASRVVSRGDSLWLISRVTYGEGMRYAVVYKANQAQIRNPNRIYPGQIFVLPLKAR